MAKQEFWVRVQPYDPQRGHVAIIAHTCGRKWEGGNGLDTLPRWYGPVTQKVAEVLRLEVQPIGPDPRPDGPRLFQIVTPKERREIDAYEAEIRARYMSGMLGSDFMDKAPTLARAVEAMRKQHVTPAARRVTRKPVNSLRDIDPEQGDIEGELPSVTGSAPMAAPPSLDLGYLGVGEEPEPLPSDDESLEVPGRLAAIDGMASSDEEAKGAVEAKLDATLVAEQDAATAAEDDEALVTAADSPAPVVGLPVAPAIPTAPAAPKKGRGKGRKKS